MKKITLIIILGFSFLPEAQSQKKGMPRYFGEPILTDSLSTIFFPTRYSEDFLSSNKIALGGHYYANIVVYDFTKDSYKKLFESDTYIVTLGGNNHYVYGVTNSNMFKNMTTKWVFLLVKNKDYNASGRIDDNDPSILFVTTTRGENLKLLTDETENVVSVRVFDAQNFALIKIQRDSNKDKSFKSGDEDFYYRKIDLTDLSMGKAIELQ